NLELHVFAVANTREEESVADQPGRACNTVHEVPYGHRLLGGEDRSRERVWDALGRPRRRLAGELYRAGGDVAENRHLHLAVEEHILDVVPEVEPVAPERRPDEGGAPGAPRAAALVQEPVG